MEIERINWITFQLDKYKSYFFVLLFVLSLCFPFNPPHSTSNLIENLHLPEIAYPISYAAIFVTFILMLVSFGYKLTRISKMSWNSVERTLTFDHTQIDLDGRVDFTLTIKSQDRYDNKTVWALNITAPHKKSFNILLTHKEKQVLQEQLDEGLKTK